MLALLAVVGMAALSGWHGATFHDDDPVHATSVQHVHVDGPRVDPDATIHLAAHAVGLGVAIPSPMLPSTPLPRSRMAWVPNVVAIRHGLDPASLLRPPRG